jgi:hypothetical protein
MSDFVAAFLVLIAIATAGNFAIGSDAISTQCVNGFLGICF